MRQIFRYILIVLFITGSGCKNKYTSETEQLKNYLKRIHKSDIPKNGLFFILPLQACNFCVKSTIDKINNIENPEKVYIIITDYTKLRLNNISKKISDFRVLSDPKMQIADKVNFYSNEYPIILLIKNKKILQILRVKVNENNKEVDRFIKNALLHL